MFSCEFCVISKNTFFHRTPPVAASVLSMNDGELSNYQYSFLCSPPLIHEKHLVTDSQWSKETVNLQFVKQSSPTKKMMVEFRLFPSYWENVKQRQIFSRYGILKLGLSKVDGLSKISHHQLKFTYNLCVMPGKWSIPIYKENDKSCIY